MQKYIHRLACWSEKQFNLTLQMLSSLLTNVDSVRHATLQNHAAVDFYYWHMGIDVKILKECVALICLTIHRAYTND